MTNEELMALPDVTPGIGYTTREIDGKTVNIPHMTGPGVALWQQADDGMFVAQDGQRWITGWRLGQRVRQLAASDRRMLFHSIC